MDTNKPLREQGADQVWYALATGREYGVEFETMIRAADAAIKALDEARRCGTCRWWFREDMHCSRSTDDDFACGMEWCGIDYGCIYWEQKQ